MVADLTPRLPETPIGANNQGMTPLVETRAAVRRVWANCDLRRICGAAGLTTLAESAYLTGVVVWAYDAGGPRAVGAVLVPALVLVTVLTPFVGALIDRFPAHRLVTGLCALRAVLAVASGLAVWLEAPFALVLGLLVAVTVVGAPFRPTRAAAAPGFARTPYELTAANAVTGTAESLAFFLGPALAGSTLALAGPWLVFVLCGAALAGATVLCFRLGTPAEPDPTDGDRSDVAVRIWLTELFAGFQQVGRERGLLLVTGISGAQAVIAGALKVFVVVVAADVLRTGSAGAGLLNAVLGAGAIAGGLVAIARSNNARAALDIGTGVFGWAMAPLAIAIHPVPWIAIAAFALVGVFNSIVDVNELTLLQRLAPARLLGHVLGAYWCVINAALALGALLMPLVLAGLGLRAGLVAVCAPVALLMMACLGALRSLDRRTAPPPQLRLVREQPLFAPLSPAAQETIARALLRRELAAGEAVIVEGDVCVHFFLIGRGRLQARRRRELLSEMGPGDCFGEIALLRDVPRTATVVARTKAVVYALAREDFLTAVSGDPTATMRAEALAARRMAR
jgi:MFS family permease